MQSEWKWNSLRASDEHRPAGVATSGSQESHDDGGARI